jgi:hypothetical protein
MATAARAADLAPLPGFDGDAPQCLSTGSVFCCLLLTLQVGPSRRDVDVTDKPFLLDGEERLDGCARRQR